MARGGICSAQRAWAIGFLLWVSIPARIGTFSFPVSHRNRSTIRALNCVLPHAVLIPNNSISGLVKTRASANTSSMSSPMSVSRMTFSRTAVATGCWADARGEDARKIVTSQVVSQRFLISCSFGFIFFIRTRKLHCIMPPFTDPRGWDGA